MAVVQISRIQVRRGQKNQGSGLPQLASGEFGWAIDTRELYIGNGAVSEGSPEVGNTEILTQYSDIFALADSYSYRADDSYIQTGDTTTSPVTRTLQERLDDRVSVRAFGVTGDGSTDDTVALQRAIDQLYLNSATKGSKQSRVTLYLEPGEYIITDTVYIPPYATIQGAGSEKTFIKQTADAVIFQTVNESSTPGTPANDSSSTFNNQARNILLQGLTLETTQTNKGLVLQSCRDSEFRDIVIKGSWTYGDSSGTDSTQCGLEINSLSGAVSSDNNSFYEVTIKNFSHGIVSNYDIKVNSFFNGTLTELGYGIVFGETRTPGAPGQTTGALNNSIKNTLFQDIRYSALWIEAGEGNVSCNNVYKSVANDEGNEGNPQTSVIKFTTKGNDSISDFFSRTANLSYNQNYINNVPYIGEIEGKVDAVFAGELEVEINSTGASPVKLFRLPAGESKTVIVKYTVESNNYSIVRNGELHVTYNSIDDDVILVDSYDYAGASAYLEDIEFSVQTIDENMDGDIDTLGIYVLNSASNDESIMKFKINTKQ